MHHTTRRRTLATLAVAGMLALGGAPATAGASEPAPQSLTCSGGEIASGTYARISVTGPCAVAPNAVITVVGNIDVAAGAMFDAQSAPSTLTVGRNVTGAAGALVGLGCQPDRPGRSGHPCASPYEADSSSISVSGNVTVDDGFAVLINGTTVKGNVTLTGGGSFIPWSIKNNTLGRNLTVSGQQTEWLGVLFNTIAGNATLTDIALSDPHPGAPGVYIVRNTIGRNLNCSGLTPGVSGGFVPGSVNVVGRNATGQCAALV